MDHTGSLVSAWTAKEQPHTCPRESPHGAHKVKTSQVEGEQTSDGHGNNEDLSCALRDPEQNLFSSVRQLHFKTSLLEMVEELRMRRDSEHHFEEKFNKLITEKQELEWQKDSLVSKRESLLAEHLEEITKINMQFKSKLESLEAEKNKLQFLFEAGEREVNSLKEKIKAQNLSVHSLETKLADQDQKLKLQMLGRERVLSQLSEVGNLHSRVRKECESYRQTYEVLERNVQEYLKLNKKLLYTNNHQRCIQEELRQKLQQSSAELLRVKVDLQAKTDERKREMNEKHHKLEEAQRQLQKEMDLVKQLSQELTAFRQENQEMNKALEESQRLIERQCVHVNRDYNVALLKENQVLKDDNEKLKRFMTKKDENCKDIKGRFENTTITLEEEKRKQQFKFESLQAKYDILQDRFQQIEASNCELKLKLSEQEGTIKGLQHSVSYQEDENKMRIDSLESTLAGRDLEIRAFCKTNKEYVSKETQSDNQIPCSLSDTMKITSDEGFKKTEGLTEEQKESQPLVNDISGTDANITTDNPSDTSPVLCKSPQVFETGEENTKTQSHVIEDDIAITNMETESNLNLITPEKQVIADICEVTESAQLLDLSLQNTKINDSSENLCQQNVSQVQSNPTISKYGVATLEPKEKCGLSPEEQQDNENDDVIVSHEISNQKVLGEKTEADKINGMDIQLISAEASLTVETHGIPDNINESSTVTHSDPDSVYDALPLVIQSVNEGSVFSVPEGMDDQLFTSVDFGAASVNLETVQLANIAIEVATIDKQIAIAPPDASVVEICELVRMPSTEIQPAFESDNIACEEYPVTDAFSTAENHIIDLHAIRDNAIKHASPEITFASKDEKCVTQLSQLLETVRPMLFLAVDGSVTNSETKGCAPPELPDQSPIELERFHISEKHEDADGEITPQRQSITDNKNSVCSAPDSPNDVILSFARFINVCSNKPTSSSNTESNHLIEKCLAKDPATETASVPCLTSSHATNPAYYSMYRHVLSEREDIKAPTSHTQSYSLYPTSASNATSCGDRRGQGGRSEPPNAAPQVARHTHAAAVTWSSTAHNTKNIFSKHGIPGNRSQGSFTGDVIGGAKRKRDYVVQWNAIAKTFDVEQPSSKRDFIGKTLNVSASHEMAPVCALPGPDMGLETKRNVNDLEPVAFSDDEEENWAMGNQITDIQNLLNVDRLKLSKKRQCLEDPVDDK